MKILSKTNAMWYHITSWTIMNQGLHYKPFCIHLNKCFLLHLTIRLTKNDYFFSPFSVTMTLHLSVLIFTKHKRWKCLSAPGFEVNSKRTKYVIELKNCLEMVRNYIWHPSTVIRGTHMQIIYRKLWINFHRHIFKSTASFSWQVV